MQLLINGLVAGSLAALMAGGLSLVYGVLGIFNLALGQLALVGGMTTWWLHQQMELPLMVSILGGLFVGGIVTWLTFEIAVAPFYRRDRFLPLVTTIAWSMILDALILLGFQEYPRSILTGSKHYVEMGSARFSLEQVCLVAATLIFVSGVAWMLHSTSFGRKIRATVQHADAARSLGISSSLLHRIVFIASGVLAACGGIYVGIDQNISPTLAFPITIKAYAALIAGGKDNFWGTIAAAYLIAMIEQLAVGTPWFFGQYISAGYQSSIALIFIIGVLLIRPSGLFSRTARTA
ncbi:MAG: branched-chain amino acid ABC transporter permease [Candidatus Peribacteraceae bacterium]|nr:branched-chain amino acid ABC transporter permease [Candidatus Peribacteraceae bacterium]